MIGGQGDGGGGAVSFAISVRPAACPWEKPEAYIIAGGGEVKASDG